MHNHSILKLFVLTGQSNSLGTADPAFRYIDTMDLQSQRYDHLHFSKPAKLELGRRMARAWLEWEKPGTQHGA